MFGWGWVGLGSGWGWTSGRLIFAGMAQKNGLELIPGKILPHFHANNAFLDLKLTNLHKCLVFVDFLLLLIGC